MPKKLTTEEFIEKAKAVHSDKYDYSLVEYKNAKTKVKIICPVHGIFEQIPDNHLSNKKCLKCAIIDIKEKQRHTTEEFIEKAKIIHKDFYDYSLVEYKNNRTKVKIICPIHGIFEQNPKHHLNGQGCPECRYIKSGNKKKLTIEEFIERSNNIHDNKYDYSLAEYKNIKTKVKIICPVHGVFEQEADSHQRGNGCPKCASHISRQETEVQDFIKSLDIDVICNDRSLISPYELDIVIPFYKLAIEYNGLYWHSEQQGKDQYYHLNKYNQCKENGYRLISIREDEWLFKQDIVKSIICSALGIYKRRIGARQCRVMNIKPKEARNFYNDNHIQGFQGGKHLGLIYENELVSLLTIRSDGELCRFVTKKYMQVYGAFSKLLKAFNLDYIYTFADLRYFTGNVYSMNGFKYIHDVKPRYNYIKKYDIYHRRHFQKKNIEHKYNKGELSYYNPNETEYVNMVKNGYDRIWDCGKIKYEYIE